ncbi:MAG TPA: cytochrome c3 family protein [Candidatus Acidoferrales bacterium]|nr:cytochrome c3 family protein [Candidatus Acidoferrales bacterium]
MGPLRLGISACALAGLLLGAAGNAATGGAADNSGCLACHGQQGVQSESGRSLYVGEDHFKKSAHGSLACTDCHTSIKGFPHPANVEPVKCATCHASEASDVAESVHAKASALPCLGCHGNPHGILPVSDPQSPVYPLNVPRTCGTCHGNPEMAKKYGLPNVYLMYVDSIHGFALTKDGLLVAASCSSCHGTHKILSRTNPQSRTYRTNVPNTCGSCHAGPKADYLAGIHGQQMVAGNPRAPVCSDCHTAHQIARVETVAWQVKTSATCGNCHQEKYATYLDTFHAQVSALGYIETAHCWNCHSFHAILPASKANSPVNPANLVATCRQCHPSTTAGLVSYQPHANPRDRKAYPALWLTTLFMNLLLLGVLGFFSLHTILWFIRSVFDRERGAAQSEVRQ